MYNADNSIYKNMQNRCTGNGKIDENVDINSCNDSRESGKSGLVITGFPLASVYSPIQNFIEIYDCEKGLKRGTIFAQLDLPFICGGDKRG